MCGLLKLARCTSVKYGRCSSVQQRSLWSEGINHLTALDLSSSVQNLPLLCCLENTCQSFTKFKKKHSQQQIKFYLLYLKSISHASRASRTAPMAQKYACCENRSSVSIQTSRECRRALPLWGSKLSSWVRSRSSSQEHFHLSWLWIQSCTAEVPAPFVGEMILQLFFYPWI